MCVCVFVCSPILSLVKTGNGILLIFLCLKLRSTYFELVFILYIKKGLVGFCWEKGRVKVVKWGLPNLQCKLVLFFVLSRGRRSKVIFVFVKKGQSHSFICVEYN